MLPPGTIGPDVKVLCTLKLARALIPKTRFGDHKLSTLWYGFGLYKEEVEYKGVPHRAGYDCYMTAKVLECILKENELTIESALDLVQPKPIHETLCLMKKYKDQKLTWKEVKEYHPDYCSWLVQNYNWNDSNTELRKYLSE